MISHSVSVFRVWVGVIGFGWLPCLLQASVEDAFLRAVTEDLRMAANHLLSSGAPVDAADSEGTTALMLAARNGNRALVDALLAKGAEPRRVRPDGYTLVMAAAESGDVGLFDLVTRRMGYGAPVTERGYSLLMAAARGGNADLFGRVSQRDTNFERVTDQGFSLLMAAAEGGEPEVFSTVRKRLDLPGYVMARPATGETLLHFAAEGGSVVIVKQLLASGLGALVDTRNLDGETALFVAAQRGRSALARVLLEDGADAALADRNGRTPLHEAALRGDRSVVGVLLAGGAPADVADDAGKTPLHAILQYFAECGFMRPYNRVEERSLVEAEETARLLLLKGADPNRGDNAGETPIHLLARSRFPELVPMLRSAGAVFDQRCANGRSPLDVAQSQGFAPMIRVLEAQSGPEKGR